MKIMQEVTTKVIKYSDQIELNAHKLKMIAAGFKLVKVGYRDGSLTAIYKKTIV